MIMKKSTRIVIASVCVAITLLFASFAVYVSIYYRADADAVLEYEASDRVEQLTLKNGDIIFDSGETDIGAVFYPGGKVEYTAYIPLMERLAETGVFCVLCKMPFNLAFFDVHAADDYKELLPAVKRWFIGGHSLGGVAASMEFNEHAGIYEGLFLLASYPAADIAGQNAKILSIYGSEDGVLNAENYENFRSNVATSDFTEKVIEGGNHAGFGMYGEQKRDGKATITNKEQIEQTAELIFDWID